MSKYTKRCKKAIQRGRGFGLTGARLDDFACFLLRTESGNTHSTKQHALFNNDKVRWLEIVAATGKPANFLTTLSVKRCVKLAAKMQLEDMGIEVAQNDTLISEGDVNDRVR